MSFSSTSLHSPSTIKISLAVPATIKSISASFASVMLGLTMKVPLILQTRTSETGPLNGISEMLTAADAARQARLSGETSISAEINVTAIWISA